MIAASELLTLIATRRCFTLTIESGGDETWRIVLSDAHNEMRGEGADFESAWLDLALVENDPMASDAHHDAAVSEMLNMARIWCDLYGAISEVEREASHGDPLHFVPCS